MEHFHHQFDDAARGAFRLNGLLDQIRDVDRIAALARERDQLMGPLRDLDAVTSLTRPRSYRDVFLEQAAEHMREHQELIDAIYPPWRKSAAETIREVAGSKPRPHKVVVCFRRHPAGPEGNQDAID